MEITGRLGVSEARPALPPWEEALKMLAVARRAAESSAQELRLRSVSLTLAYVPGARGQATSGRLVPVRWAQPELADAPLNAAALSLASPASALARSPGPTHTHSGGCPQALGNRAGEPASKAELAFRDLFLLK